VDKGEINNRINQLSDAAGNGSVIEDRNRLLLEIVVGKPMSLFLGEGVDITAIDKFIAFEKLFDRMPDIDANVFAHAKTRGVSREFVRPSKHLPGSPFYLIKTSSTPPTGTETIDKTLNFYPLLLSCQN
jgi:hypothetical protein